MTSGSDYDTTIIVQNSRFVNHNSLAMRLFGSSVILFDVLFQGTAASDTVKAKHGVFDDQIAIIALDILLGLLDDNVGCGNVP